MSAAATQAGSLAASVPSDNAALDSTHTADVKTFLRSLPNRSDLEALLYTLRESVFTEEEVTRAWFDATTLVKTYSDQRVEQWKGEIENYLFFAGLFSAILTAFNVECFSLLQPPMTHADNVSLILRHISLQLSSFSNNPPFLNSSLPPFSISDLESATTTSTQVVPISAVLLNILLFASLMFSLCSAFIGILVLQWLKTFTSELPGDSRLTAWLRQNRLNSLDEWHVEHFVRAVPLTLQISLLLFLAGLLVLLWTLNRVVFAIVCALAVVLTSVFGGTTILPLLQPTCAYLSPQTFGLYFTWSHARRFVRAPLGMLAAIRKGSSGGSPRPSPARATHATPFSDILSSAAQIPSFFQAWRWSAPAEPLTADGHNYVGTWQERERSLVKSTEVRRRLDIDILHTAYNATLDPNTLAIAAACLIRGAPQDIVTWFRKLDHSVESDVPNEEAGLGTGVATSFTLSGHGARTVLWAIVLQSMIRLDVQEPGQGYIAEAWKRAAFQLAACLSSAYRNDHFRLTKQQLDWIVCVIFWMMWPEPIKYDSGAEGTFPPRDGMVTMKGLIDALHDLFHHILAVRRSDQDKADVISPDVAEFAAVLAFRRLESKTPGRHPRQGPTVAITDWFSIACATVDLMAILSQISPMKMTDGPSSFHAPMELESGHFDSSRPNRLDRQQFLALGRHALFCLHTGLLFYASPEQSKPIRWSISDLLVVVPHLFQTLGDHAPLFGPLMPQDLPDSMARFNDALVNALKVDRRSGSVAPLSMLLKYTLARIQIVNYSARSS